MERICMHSLHICLYVYIYIAAAFHDCSPNTTEYEYGRVPRLQPSTPKPAPECAIPGHIRSYAVLPVHTRSYRGSPADTRSYRPVVFHSRSLPLQCVYVVHYQLSFAHMYTCIYIHIHIYLFILFLTHTRTYIYIHIYIYIYLGVCNHISPQISHDITIARMARSDGHWTRATRARSQSRCQPSTHPTRPPRPQLTACGVAHEPIQSDVRYSRPRDGSSTSLCAHELEFCFVACRPRVKSLHGNASATSCVLALMGSTSTGPCATRHQCLTHEAYHKPAYASLSRSQQAAGQNTHTHKLARMEVTLAQTCYLDCTCRSCKSSALYCTCSSASEGHDLVFVYCTMTWFRKS